MRLELYLAETRDTAIRQQSMLDAAARALDDGETLSALEENGVLHALQILVENAIGKAKHLLKDRGEAVPVSAYDAFQRLAELGDISRSSLEHWNAVIGLRNRIVHGYMNLDMSRVLELVRQRDYMPVVEYLVEDGAT